MSFSKRGFQTMDLTVPSENISQACDHNKRDTVSIPKEQLRNILAENSNARIKLKALDNLQRLLVEKNRGLNEAKRSLNDYKMLYKRSMRILDQQLRTLCQVGASKTSEDFGVKSQPWQQNELQPVLDETRAERSSLSYDFIEESEGGGTLELGDAIEFYIRDIDTPRPEVVMLPDLGKYSVEGRGSFLPDAPDCDVECIVQEDGCLKSMKLLRKNTNNIKDDMHMKGDLEHLFRGDASESKGAQDGIWNSQASQGVKDGKGNSRASQGVKDGKGNSQASQGVKDGKGNSRASQGEPGEAVESHQQQTAMRLSGVLVKSPDFVHGLIDSDVYQNPSVYHPKRCEVQKENFESELLRRNKPDDIYRKQKESNDEFQRKHTTTESDHLILSNVKKSAESGMELSTPTNIRTTHACTRCRTAERVRWLTEQNKRLKNLMRSILTRVSLTPASFLTLQEYEDTVVQLRQRISDLERRLTHLENTPGSVKVERSSENVGQQSADATIKMRQLERSVYIKQIMINALHKRIKQLNQESQVSHHHHHPQQRRQQQQQQQQPENMELISQSLSNSERRLPIDPNGQFLMESGFIGTSTIQSTCSAPKAKYIPGTSTLQSSCYEPRTRDTTETMAIQDTCVILRAADKRVASAVQGTSNDHSAKNNTETMAVQDTCISLKPVDIRGTSAPSAIQDTRYDPSTEDNPGTITVQTICSGDPENRQGAPADKEALQKEYNITSPLMTDKSFLERPSDHTAHNQETSVTNLLDRLGDGAIGTIPDEPCTSGVRKEERGEEIGYAEQNEDVAEQPWLSPDWNDLIRSRIYGAPGFELAEAEKDEGEDDLVSIHSLDIFVCPRCERDFDTAEEGRYVEHLQKCLDYG